MSSVKHLEFDSKVFRLQTGALSSTCSALSSDVSRCALDGYKLLYCTPPPEDDSVILSVLEPLDVAVFRAPISIRFRLDLKEDVDSQHQAIQSPNIRSATIGEATASVEELAIAAGSFSRFRRDPSLSRAKFESLFCEWASNSTRRTVSDEVYIAWGSPSNPQVEEVERGFATLKKTEDGTTAVLGLLAVDASARRCGYGSALLRAAVAWANGNGCRFVDVTTQADNLAACGFYSRFGFKEFSRSATFHLWLPSFSLPPCASLVVRHTVPYMTGRESKHLRDMVASRKIDSLGPFHAMCTKWLKDEMGCDHPLLTSSGTAALEHAAILCGLAAGDEVIMPSFTFPSTANAAVLRGATPVFVDVRPDTFNVDERLIQAAITPKTKAIFVVHYAGVPCEMDTIMQIAQDNNLLG